MATTGLLFVLEILVAVVVVSGAHALRRSTSLVYTYAAVAFMTVGSWVTPHEAVVQLGMLEFHLESSVFFTAALVGVFLLYVADGPRAGRMGLVVVIGSGVVYSAFAAVLGVHFGGESSFPLADLRASTASVLAAIVDLLLLGIVWESCQKSAQWLPLFGRVFATLLAVLVADALVYIPTAWAGDASLSPTLFASLLARGVLALLYAPVVVLYLLHETRHHGLALAPRPVLAIVTREDLERELLSARHSLRIGAEALWESEERYRRMVEDIPVMVFRFSIDGTVTYANQALCRYYRRDVADVVGLSVLLPIAKAERADVWRRVQSLTPATPTADIVVRVFPRPGERRVHRWVVRSIFSRDGEGIAYQAIGEDITDQRERERTVQRLQTAIAHASDCVGITDAEGRIEFVNSALETASGLSADQLIGTEVRDHLAYQHELALLEPLAQAMAHPEGWSGRLTLNRRGGEGCAYQVAVTPIHDADSEGGVATGFVAIARDVSEQAEIEARVQQVGRMEAVAQLAGGVAHDFNNVLTVVSACVGLALDGLTEGTADDVDGVVAALRDARGGVERAAQLTRELMALGRREPTEPQRINLQDVVLKVVPLLRRILPRNIEITARCEGKVSPVLADPMQVERAVMNLVVNARDAMPDGGELALATLSEDVAEDNAKSYPEARSGSHSVLEVRDTGGGMDGDTARRIFEPFFTTKEGSGGTGLGLSVVYGIARQTGGHVRVRSAVGVGSTFSIYFPVPEIGDKAATDS